MMVWHRFMDVHFFFINPVFFRIFVHFFLSLKIYCVKCSSALTRSAAFASSSLSSPFLSLGCSERDSTFYRGRVSWISGLT
jgi:hypothetical protein